jgi:hypothetical protein
MEPESKTKSANQEEKERVFKIGIRKEISTGQVSTAEKLTLTTNEEDKSMDEGSPNAIPKEAKISLAGDGLFSAEVNSVNISALAKPKRSSKSRQNVDGCGSPKNALKAANLFINLPKDAGSQEELEASLKATKAPDPFETEHYRTAQQLKYIISNTSNPDNPFYHLHRQTSSSPSTQKAYKDYIISIFESIWLVKSIKEKPITEEQVTKQKLSLKKPNHLSCTLI